MTFRILPAIGVYKTVALGFFDLLGFKDLLERECSESPDFLLGLISTADFFTNPSFPFHIERRIISDSIVIWTEDLNQGLLGICNIGSLLQVSLLKSGCLIRGGICLGKHFSEHIRKHDVGSNITRKTADEVIVSPVLAKAAQLEKKISLPRIVLENNPDLNRHLEKARMMNPHFNVHVEKDPQGFYSIDGWFTSHELLGFSHRHSPNMLGTSTKEKMYEACKPQAQQELKGIRVHILKGLDNTDRRVKAKW